MQQINLHITFTIVSDAILFMPVYPLSTSVLILHVLLQYLLGLQDVICRCRGGDRPKHKTNFNFVYCQISKYVLNITKHSAE